MEHILAISDTHGMHNHLKLDLENVDCIIHSGDSTNYYDLYRNEREFDEFILWYANLPVKHKILIAGNHDGWSMKNYNLEKVKSLGITYLEHEYHEIDGVLFFGSPYTPTFGQWYHMKDRSKLNQYWEVLNEGIDVLITHGPPKGILDLSENPDRELEMCGDKSLLRRVLKTKPKYHVFGHLHNNKECINQGIRVFENTTFINASCVTDGRFDYGPSSHGLKFKL